MLKKPHLEKSQQVSLKKSHGLLASQLPSRLLGQLPS
jgi:hypothetical protein